MKLLLKKSAFFLIISCCVLLQTTAKAQTRQVAVRGFLKQLNEIVIKTSEHSPWHDQGKYSVDSLFSINKAGILSITFRYTTDTAFTRVRMTAPVSKIKDIFYDYYLGFKFSENWVTVYQTMPGSNRLKEMNTDNLFHIGMPTYDGEYQQGLLKKALLDVQRYYKE